MSHWEDRDPPEGIPTTRADFYLAILNEVKGKLSERQLDGLAEHRYHVPYVGSLDLDQLKDLYQFLRTWALNDRVTSQAAAEQKKANKRRGAA